MTPILILDEAQIELWEAVAFYENRCAGLGLDFEKEIKASLETIQQAPGRWPIHLDGTRRYLVTAFRTSSYTYLRKAISGSSPSLTAEGGRGTGRHGPRRPSPGGDANRTVLVRGISADGW